MNPIEQTLDFLIELEKLKDVHRKTRPVGLKRYENSAEHSWHVCVAALMLKDYADEEIDINRVIKMLLIHDIGEIDAGDTIIYESETKDLKSKEETGLKRILKLLPGTQGEQYLNLWLEFEAGETSDARFAQAVDRVPPLLHNLHDDGHSWKKHNISKEQVLTLNRRIAKGSVSLWSVMKSKLEKAVKSGLLSN